MDSPLLPRLRGNAQPIDETLGEMSLIGADSPAPPHGQNQTSRGTAGTSLFNRPKPTRQIDETPESFRTLGGISSTSTTSASASASSKGPQAQAWKPRYSLFAPRPNHSQRTLADSQSSLSQSQARTHEEEVVYEENEAEDDLGGEEGTAEGDRTVTMEPEEQTGVGRANREERLRESLYELRGMNDAFEVFLDALESARGHNVRLAARVTETTTLLDQYIALLGQTEHTRQLLANQLWTGSEDDAQAVAAERAAQEAAEMEAARKAEETRRLAEEERERQEEAARAREAAAAKPATRGRGIPGSRGVSTRGRGSGIPAPTARTVSNSKAPSVRKAPEGLGLAGQYANVKSSGYGPSRKAT